VKDGFLPVLAMTIISCCIRILQIVIMTGIRVGQESVSILSQFIYNQDFLIEMSVRHENIRRCHPVLSLHESQASRATSSLPCQPTDHARGQRFEAFASEALKRCWKLSKRSVIGCMPIAGCSSDCWKGCFF
jgi:hypothetical protein